MPFETTVDYVCGKCRLRGVKLWRGIHGCTIDGHELLCAKCLAPNTKVDDEGKCHHKYGIFTDQVENGLPAVPVQDTFYGYSSVPAEGVRWWKNLPTYEVCA